MHKTTASVDGTCSRTSTSCTGSNWDSESSHVHAIRPPTVKPRRELDESKGGKATIAAGSRASAFGAAGGKRTAFVRIPEKRAAIIILTNDATADVKVIADQITDRLLFSKKAK